MRIFLFLFLFIASGCTSNQPLTLSYSNLKFNLPEDPVAIGLGGGKGSVLIVKYSKELGKEYIAFTKETGVYIGSCNYKQFFNRVINSDSNENCGGDAIQIFKSTFLHGTLNRNDVYVYYSFKTKKNSAVIFLLLDEASIIKIDSDFLGREQLSHVLPLKHPLIKTKHDKGCRVS